MTTVWFVEKEGRSGRRRAGKFPGDVGEGDLGDIRTAVCGQGLELPEASRVSAPPVASETVKEFLVHEGCGVLWRGCRFHSEAALKSSTWLIG